MFSSSGEIGCLIKSKLIFAPAWEASATPLINTSFCFHCPVSFKKFEEGRLSEDDPFGYIAQLSGYEKAIGTDGGGFLALNKESGELCLYRREEQHKIDIPKKIKQVKQLIEEKELKEFNKIIWKKMINLNGLMLN